MMEISGGFPADDFASILLTLLIEATGFLSELSDLVLSGLELSGLL
jgi:hypothetical protein